VKRVINKIIIYPGGVTSVHLDIALSETQFVRFWWHQSHQWHQHCDLSLPENRRIRCKVLKQIRPDISHTEIRSARPLDFAFWKMLHTEIRNKKCSGCENRNKSQPTYAVFHILPTVVLSKKSYLFYCNAFTITIAYISSITLLKIYKLVALFWDKSTVA